MKIACGYTIPITLFGIPPSPENHLKALEIVGKAGFQAIELELYDNLLPAHRRDLKKMQTIINNYGMTVPSIMAVEEDMFSLERSKSEKAVCDFDVLTDLIGELEVPLVSICGYMPSEIRPQGTELYAGGPPTAVSIDDDFSWPRFWENAVRMVSKFAAISKAKGLTLLIETRANDWVGTTDSIMKLIGDSQADHVGVILDVAHIHASKEYLTLAIRKLGSLIKLVHLSDNDGSQAYHLPPGKGNIDFQGVLHNLTLIGFDGTLVIDIAGVDHIIDEAILARRYFEGLLAKEQ
ncbi:MAG: sugar phosphate isomerase/epimerase [Anaerolineales bacterium]|jgi:sugar phosphate isomerase/epimerase